MLNSKMFKLAQKAVSMIRFEALLTTVKGVIEDVEKGIHPDGAHLIPAVTAGEAGTVGAIKAIKGWSTDAEIVGHLAGASAGRMAQFLLADNGIHPMTISPNQMVTLLDMTNEIELRVIQTICGKEKADAYWNQKQAAEEEFKKLFVGLSTTPPTATKH